MKKEKKCREKYQFQKGEEILSSEVWGVCDERIREGCVIRVETKKILLDVMKNNAPLKIVWRPKSEAGFGASPFNPNAESALTRIRANPKTMAGSRFLSRPLRWDCARLSGTVSAILSRRFFLSVPAVILDDYSVGRAMVRSDELTQGKWLALAALLAKSLIGGYVAGMCPFWLASFIRVSVPLPSWFPWMLTGASIILVSVVEPTMFIGFALLYLKMSAKPLAHLDMRGGLREVQLR